MKLLATISDPVFEGGIDYSAIDRFFLKLIRDERDLPFIYLTLKISFIMIPIGLGMYFTSGWLFALLAVSYFLVNNFVFKGPFGLMLHCTSHRKWFKPEYEWFNKYLPWIVGPFFGQSPETYYSHHVHMHHAENNLPDDLSSTMFYQRDSFKDWFRYFWAFFWMVVVDLIRYFLSRNRKQLARKVALGEYLFLGMVAVLCYVNFWATFMVFILPLLLSRIIMMMGNWAQHCFIDPADPGNPFYNSITCINHKYNHKCWNDGYHISHHQKPHMHWTEHPIYFQKTIDQYAAHQALIFDGLDFLGVYMALMRGKYEFLADHLVNVDGMFRDRNEAIAVMKRRVQRFPDGWQPA
ncbi:MAG TPA: fatty acid desaturase [Saprospiraceae bacterium]|nr:fatty acid desaturase [Saprospiraceae bacterium]HMQ83729.1 fatty acid desaturase [Saprospiraceae bacterium]